jgi:hypothetical protein
VVLASWQPRVDSWSAVAGADGAPRAAGKTSGAGRPRRRYLDLLLPPGAYAAPLQAGSSGHAIFEAPDPT